MKPLVLALLLVSFLSIAGKLACQTAAAPKYIKVPQGYLMVLKQGDSLFKELKAFAIRENIPSATFSGMGFVNITFGFFNAAKKEYKEKKFNDLELASLNGSIAWQNGLPSLHAHGVGADAHFRVRAGHILSAVVSTGSLELIISVHDKKLERVKDETLGANVLDLGR